MTICDPTEKPLMVLHLLHHMNVRSALCFTKSVESVHRLCKLIQLFENRWESTRSSHVNQTQAELMSSTKESKISKNSDNEKGSEVEYSDDENDSGENGSSTSGDSRRSSISNIDNNESIRSGRNISSNDNGSSSDSEKSSSDSGSEIESRSDANSENEEEEAKEEDEVVDSEYGFTQQPINKDENENENEDGNKRNIMEIDVVKNESKRIIVAEYSSDLPKQVRTNILRKFKAGEINL
jgi:hypothetical protein